MTMDHLLGIGLRYPHYREILENMPDIGWFEVHSENFLHPGSIPMAYLLKIRSHYPISIHGVGLSLGSMHLDNKHLFRLKNLINQLQPFLVSEHLTWNQVNNHHLPDLINVVYTTETLDVFVRNIQQTQYYLQKQILIENPSSYFEYKMSSISEVDFLIEVVRRSGAKILLDVNNVYISSYNNNFNPKHYIDSIPVNLVAEIHIAGHSDKQITNEIIKIDTHNNFVSNEVWQLYEHAVKRFGPTLTLLEWDADIPALSTLINEVQKAKLYLPNEVDGYAFV